MPHHSELRAQAREKIKELLDAVGIEKINGKKHYYLINLLRRAIYLEQRIAIAHEGKSLYFDKAEATAIQWLVSQTINQEAELKRLREDMKKLRGELQERRKGGTQ